MSISPEDYNPLPYKKAFTPDRVREIGRSCPIIREALAYFGNGTFTWVEAMQAVVVCLAEENERLKGEQLKAGKLDTQPHWAEEYRKQIMAKVDSGCGYLNALAPPKDLWPFQLRWPVRGRERRNARERPRSAGMRSAL